MSLIFCAILQDARLSASLKWTISRLGLSGNSARFGLAAIAAPLAGAAAARQNN
jgi:hypothetical protein